MAKWQGTVVPNSGYVEKVYFNTNLSVDEVVNILSQLTLVNNGYGIVSNESETFSVIVLQEESVFAIVDFLTETYYFVSNDYLGFTGWNPNFNGIIEVNSNVIAQNSSGDSFGTQNNLLTNLLSTTPFTQSQPTTADKLQKLIDGKQYVIDKTNAKAGTSLNIKSKWKDIGDTIEEIENAPTIIVEDGVLKINSENASVSETGTLKL